MDIHHAQLGACKVTQPQGTSGGMLHIWRHVARLILCQRSALRHSAADGLSISDIYLKGVNLVKDWLVGAPGHLSPEVLR